LEGYLLRLLNKFDIATSAGSGEKKLKLEKKNEKSEKNFKIFFCHFEGKFEKCKQKTC
jgi:hypothetical protein